MQAGTIKWKLFLWIICNISNSFDRGGCSYRFVFPYRPLGSLLMRNIIIIVDIFIIYVPDYVSMGLIAARLRSNGINNASKILVFWVNLLVTICIPEKRQVWKRWSDSSISQLIRRMWAGTGTSYLQRWWSFSPTQSNLLRSLRSIVLQCCFLCEMTRGLIGE